MWQYPNILGLQLSLFIFSADILSKSRFNIPRLAVQVGPLLIKNKVKWLRLFCLRRCLQRSPLACRGRPTGVRTARSIAFPPSRSRGLLCLLALRLTAPTCVRISVEYRLCLIETKKKNKVGKRNKRPTASLLVATTMDARGDRSTCCTRDMFLFFPPFFYSWYRTGRQIARLNDWSVSV